MPGRKLVGAVALIAALGAGALVGLFLGIPGLSGAQSPIPSATLTPLPGWGPDGGHHRGVTGTVEPRLGVKGLSLNAAAKALGMSAADLKSALAGGQSIAAVAKSKSVDVQKVVDTLVADATSRIDDAVKAGKLTDAQATMLKQNLTARITAYVNAAPGTQPGFPGGPPFGFPKGVTGTVVPRLGANLSLDAAAKALGMSAADLKRALAGGQSIATVAKSKNVDVQKVIDALVADATSRIDAAVAAGKITAAQAATLKQNLTARITSFVNQTPPSGGHGFRGPFGVPPVGPGGGRGGIGTSASV